MKRLAGKIAKALAGGPKRPHPGPPPDEAAPVDLLDRFTTALERVAGRVVRVADEAAARKLITAEFAENSVVFAEDHPAEADLVAADVGVDRADLLLADTGTVLRSYPDRAASRISLVPETSVFLAAAADVVPGYPEAFAAIADRHREGRAYSVLITGPSRTADIEKELVIPAHGPRELVVVVIESGGRA
ncbi:MAG: LUD domain-containing protein [Planctomycetota bacterium]